MQSKSTGGLGFRELNLFNKALLAKQGQKLTIQPNCLFSCVLKAKYFPRGDFISAHLGIYPSYTWRNIWGARNLIEEGTSWRIDNRLIVNIQNDVWVLGPSDGRLKFQNIDIWYTSVSDLIDIDTFTWKNDVIKELFGADQLNRILSIPLVSNAHMDEIVWRRDRTGEYMAHSGYKWLVTRGYEIMGTNITPQNENLTNFYMRLWNLSIPSKICIHF